jgi:hypothetical protein
MENIKIIFRLSLLVVSILYSCSKTEEGKLINHSECKYNGKSVYVGQDYGSDTTSVSYVYLENANTLKFKHTNTSFNCCPGELSCDISISNDTIYIQEKASKEDCDCMCLFDVEFEVYDIKTQTYHIEIIEPYIGSQDKLSFDIDLKAFTSGEYCLGRDQYPWGM